VKGKGELYVRFEQIILPNGIIRDLTGSLGALDGRSPEGFDQEEGRITSEGNKGGDARTIGESTATGASIGVIAGAAGSNAGLGLGLGSAAGAAAGLIGVLASRGPDAMLEKGTQLDMVLDRGLLFKDEDLEFDNPLGAGRTRDPGYGPDPNRNRNNQTKSGRRFPL
jgi:type IV secretion system protein VirB10